MRGGAVPDVRIANNLLYLPTETSNTNDGTPILNAAFALAIAFVFCALCCYIRSFESSDLDRCTENMSESAQLLLSEWVESYEMKVRTNKPLSLCYPFAQHRMIVIEACPLSLESQVWHVRSICNTFITRPAAGLDRSTTLLATCEILSGGIPWRFGACTASRPPHRYHSAECHADDDGSPVMSWQRYVAEKLLCFGRHVDPPAAIARACAARARLASTDRIRSDSSLLGCDGRGANSAVAFPPVKVLTRGCEERIECSSARVSETTVVDAVGRLMRSNCSTSVGRSCGIDVVVPVLALKRT